MYRSVTLFKYGFKEFHPSNLGENLKYRNSAGIIKLMSTCISKNTYVLVRKTQTFRANKLGDMVGSCRFGSINGQVEWQSWR